MKRVFSYATGVLALGLVAAAAISATTYAATHGYETLQQLATSTLSGIGMAIGGCLGSALVLRFKAARRFMKTVILDVIKA